MSSPATVAHNTLIEVQNLKTHFVLDEGLLKAVDGVSLSIERGKTLGLVGESGCGKSVTAQSIMRIVPPPGRIVQGKILYSRPGDGGSAGTVDLASLEASGTDMRRIRGKDITMIFQEPMTSFSPLHTIGNQIMEAILLHRSRDPAEAREIATDMLAKVGIPNPGQRIDQYPHELSGGMRQRAMIAMALSCNPSLLIADEPTTALDVTVQAQVIELMEGLRQELGMSMLYITHDLGVIAEVADEVAVMYLGRIIERGSVMDIFYHAAHPYTRALLQSVPRMGRRGQRRRLQAIRGTVPIPINLVDRCAFRTRCQHFERSKCMGSEPALVEIEKGHWVRCVRYDELGEGDGALP